jgi:hypothetical protein
MNPFSPHAESWAPASWQDWIAAVGPDLASRENPCPLYQAADAPGPRPLRDEVRVWHLVGVDELLTAAATIPVSPTVGDEEEIATTLAALVQVWRESPETTLPARVVLTSDMPLFQTIAKLRAFRLLSSALARHCSRSVPLIRVLIHVQGDRAADEANGQVRMTLEAVAGILGLADELELTPLAAGEEASWRALAVGHVIREEAGLRAVADPTAGSHLVETLTADLARRAWSLFQRIEAGEDLMQSAGEALQKAPASSCPPALIVGVTHFQ